MDEDKNLDILPAGYFVMGGKGRKHEFINASEYENNDVLKEFLDHLDVFRTDNGITSIKDIDILADTPECLVIVDQASEKRLFNLGHEGFGWGEIVVIEDLLNDILRILHAYNWDYVDTIMYVPEMPILATTTNSMED